jgi:hypothetical protein
VHTGLVTDSKANPDLLSGEVLRTGGLSPAMDYYIYRDTPNYVVIDHDDYQVVAVQNEMQDGVLPAQVNIDARLARLGAAALFAADEDLDGILFEAYVFFTTSVGSRAVSISSFRCLFESIAYVVVKGMPERWQSLEKPVCTCHIYGVQQQCQHTLFVEGLGLAPRHRDFSELPGHRRPGRPKGKAKAKAKPRHA